MPTFFNGESVNVDMYIPGAKYTVEWSGIIREDAAVGLSHFLPRPVYLCCSMAVFPNRPLSSRPVLRMYERIGSPFFTQFQDRRTMGTIGAHLVIL